MSSLEQRLDQYRHRVDAVLDKLLPPPTSSPSLLHEAMHYSVFNGGKRIRPLLMYATAEALEIDPIKIDIPAAAIEMIHAYSLIHDDLPAMDDDFLRRGKPTCHIAFDEATAILAGDALQCRAFEILAAHTQKTHIADEIVRLIQLLGHASGSRGMAGGQSLDLSSTGHILTEHELETIHRHKTGALIKASVLMACVCKKHTPQSHIDTLEKFAECIGLAFQVRDDVLDIESDTDTLGKQQGKDIEDDKATYPAILGLEQAKLKTRLLYEQASQYLDSNNTNNQLLQYITDYIVKRLK